MVGRFFIHFHTNFSLYFLILLSALSSLSNNTENSPSVLIFSDRKERGGGWPLGTVAPPH
jgi:hypothetical protein